MARRDLAAVERALRMLGPDLDFPDPAGMAVAVTARLERERVRRPLFRLPVLRLPVLRPPAVLRPAWQTAVAAVAGFAILLSGVLVASPSAREAVAGWFGLRGVHVVVTPPPSILPSERPLGHGLDLGRQATLAEAEQHVGVRLLVPAALGRPDAVYVRDLSLTGAINYLVYRERPGLPRTSATGVGLLLAEFTGDISRPGLVKFTNGAKLVPVRVNGSPGYWIEQGHGVAYVDSRGNIIGDDARLAGNVLLWEQGPLTFRIESALTRAGSIRVAATIH